MNYYELASLTMAPFIGFKIIATSTEEYNANSELKENPLVVDENNLPIFKDGIANKKVVNGEIVDASSEELTAAQEVNSEVVINQDIAIAEAQREYIQYDKQSTNFPILKSHLEQTVKISGTVEISINDLPDGFWCILLRVSEGVTTYTTENGTIDKQTELNAIKDEVLLRNLGGEEYLIK